MWLKVVDVNGRVILMGEIKACSISVESPVITYRCVKTLCPGFPIPDGIAKDIEDGKDVPL